LQRPRIGVGAIYLATRKNAGSAEHVGKSVAPDHEYFHAFGRIAQQHNGRGRAWHRRIRLISDAATVRKFVTQLPDPRQIPS
jgi:hypothetical protein